MYNGVSPRKRSHTRRSILTVILFRLRHIHIWIANVYMKKKKRGGKSKTACRGKRRRRQWSHPLTLPRSPSAMDILFGTRDLPSQLLRERRASRAVDSHPHRISPARWNGKETSRWPCGAELRQPTTTAAVGTSSSAPPQEYPAGRPSNYGKTTVASNAPFPPSFSFYYFSFRLCPLFVCMGLFFWMALARRRASPVPKHVVRQTAAPPPPPPSRWDPPKNIDTAAEGARESPS